MKKEKLAKITKKLQVFDFTEYQAKAFAGLMAVQTAKATDLVSIVDIPKAKIYTVLEELLEMGVIRKKPSRPVIYTVLPPEEALDNLLLWKEEKKNQEMSLLQGIKEELVSDLQYFSRNAKPLAKLSFVELISVGVASDLETRKLIGSAEDEIKIMSGVFEYLPNVLKNLKMAAERGVRIKVLLLEKNRMQQRSRDVLTKTIGLLYEIPGIGVKFTPEMPIRGTIADNKAVIYGVDEGRPLPFLKEIAISENENMCRALNLYFEALWGKAKKL